MRPVITDLFDCISRVDDKRSKKELATILRRELEIDLQDVGVHSDNMKVTPREISLANSGKKLEAVKSYKNRTGRSLLESKRAIEAEMDMLIPSNY